ncbi:MAG: hypothetical protein JWM11_576 [Planctomycetaceae bacterium]|nr:hypothetical protein [Planctomycetaceae bacterium]
MSDAGFWRDHSGRLTFDVPTVLAVDYPAVCRSIVEAFSISQTDSLVVGPDQMFWDFRLGDQEIALDWDNWMGFMVVSRTVNADSLVRDISGWLQSTLSDKST